MVRIGINKYLCEWCNTKIDWTPKTAGTPRYVGQNAHNNHLSAGHSRVSNQLICPNCARYVSQKSWGDRR